MLRLTPNPPLRRFHRNNITFDRLGINLTHRTALQIDSCIEVADCCRCSIKIEK